MLGCIQTLHNFPNSSIWHLAIDKAEVGGSALVIPGANHESQAHFPTQLSEEKKQASDVFSPKCLSLDAQAEVPIKPTFENR